MIGTHNDEDGITAVPVLAPGIIGTPIDIQVSASSFLNAWIDYNQNGIWEASEKVAIDYAMNAGANQLPGAAGGGGAPA